MLVVLNSLELGVVVGENDMHMFQNSSYHDCHLHHFLLPLTPEWFDILVGLLAYPDCPGIQAVKRG